MVQIWAIRILGSMIISAILLGGAYLKGVTVMQGKCQQATLREYKKEKERREAIKKDVMRMSDDELDAAIAGWMR